MNSRVYYYSQLVNFPDIDLGGGLYHGRYFDYFDRARQNLLKEHGISFGELLKSGVALVVVEANVKYIQPVFFEDQLHVYSRLIDRTNKSVTLEQVMTKQKVSSDNISKNSLAAISERINVVTIKIVCVDLQTKRAMAFPEVLEKVFS